MKQYEYNQNLLFVSLIGIITSMLYPLVDLTDGDLVSVVGEFAKFCSSTSPV